MTKEEFKEAKKEITDKLFNLAHDLKELLLEAKENLENLPEDEEFWNEAVDVLENQAEALDDIYDQLNKIEEINVKSAILSKFDNELTEEEKKEVIAMIVSDGIMKLKEDNTFLEKTSKLCLHLIIANKNKGVK